MGNSASRSTQKQRQRSQRGGDYGFSGPAFVSASGAPVESRMDQIDCMEVARPPPAIGGARQRKSQRQRKSKKSQRGGGCGCNSQRGGGGGTGGYTVDVGSNDIGKMYSAITPGNCATVPTRAMVGGRRQQKQKQKQQRGGDSAASVYGLQSYSAGFDLNKPVEIPGGSAHYLDWTAYDNTCKGGARRSKKAKAKNAKKARKSQRKQRRSQQ